MRTIGSLSETASQSDHIIPVILVRLDFEGTDTAYSTTITPSATTGTITLTLGTGTWASGDVGKRVVNITDKRFGEAVITGTAGGAAIDAYVLTPFTTTDVIASGDWQLLPQAITYNTTQSTITYNQEDYLGAGELAGVSSVEESNEAKPFNITVTLSGLESSTNVSTAYNEHYQGRDGTIFMGFLNTDYQLLEDPFVYFKGRMDTMNIDGNSVSVTIQSRMVDWERARVRRFTNVDQTSRYPSDRGFEFISQMVEKELYWGRPTPIGAE